MGENVLDSVTNVANAVPLQETLNTSASHLNTSEGVLP